MNHLCPIDPWAMRVAAHLPAPIVLIIGFVTFYIDGMVLSRVLEDNRTGGVLICSALYRLRLLPEPRPLLQRTKSPRPAEK